MTTALVLCGCASPGNGAVSRASHSEAPSGGGHPVGIIAIGHSGLTGENSDPGAPGHPAKENSWATGTAPSVYSIYLRMVAARPETESHVANTATGGAPVGALAAQADAALAAVPSPALVIIQSIDQEIRCDGTDDQGMVEFANTMRSLLTSIVASSPRSKILLVGQLGRPSPEFVTQLIAQHPEVKPTLTGDGICDFYNEQGQLARSNFRALTAIIDGYEAAQARVCAEFPSCRTDGGVRATYKDVLGNFTADWNHLNVRGQAQAAQLIWPRIASLLGLS